jgi:hypothetical protein
MRVTVLVSFCHNAVYYVMGVTNLIHGHCPKRGKPSPTYISYQSAKARCNNPRRPKYKYYGARGVQFLFPDFKTFLEYMGERPPGTSLDRYPNRYGHYEPGNVRWATRSQQNKNRDWKPRWIIGLS